MRQAPSFLENDVLPENSQGYATDNPQILEMWSSGDGIEPSEWPYLMLCRDQDNNSLTWHMLCNEHNIPGLLERGLKALVDYHISDERNRNLIGIELMCRHGNKHMVLSGDALSKIA